MNESNLIPNSKRTKEELSEMGRKGGIKSGEVRRRNRELRKLIPLLFETIDEQRKKPERTLIKDKKNT